MKSDTSQLTLLGHKTVYKQDYAPEVLETFINKHPENDYWVRFNCPEFTSLCPITGQPDFATIQIDYIPGEHMVESKSLKLYLFSFRNHGAFHEDCVNIIMKDLVKLMNPKYTLLPSSRPARIASRVDLPEPDSPIRAMVCRGLTTSSTPVRMES